MLDSFEIEFECAVMLGGFADRGAAGLWVAWIGDATTHRGLDSDGVD